MCVLTHADKRARELYKKRARAENLPRHVLIYREKNSHFARQLTAGERQLHEDRKNISLDEQCRLLRAAVEDLLRLAGNPPGHELSGEGPSLLLRTPTGEWRVELNMSERSLRSTRRILHGRSRWLLSGRGREESFDDLADLMRSLNAHLRGEDMTPPEPAHLARRLSRRRCRRA